jgi:hypothetical protein
VAVVEAGFVDDDVGGQGGKFEVTVHTCRSWTWRWTSGAVAPGPGSGPRALP